MKASKAFLLSFLLLITFAAAGQVNIFLGGNLQGNYAWLNGEETTPQPGLGGGFSFVYWEHEYWFLKAGLEYSHMSSSKLEYPDDWGVPIDDPEDRLQITYTEQAVGIPLSFYYRPYERGASTLLITGTLKTMMVFLLKEDTGTLGELKLKGSDIKSRTKSAIGIGVGYQRQLDRDIYLNLIPSFNMDVRGERSYRYVGFTAELIFGIY